VSLSAAFYGSLLGISKYLFALPLTILVLCIFGPFKLLEWILSKMSISNISLGLLSEIWDPFDKLDEKFEDYCAKEVATELLVKK